MMDVVLFLVEQEDNRRNSDQEEMENELQKQGLAGTSRGTTTNNTQSKGKQRGLTENSLPHQH